MDNQKIEDLINLVRVDIEYRDGIISRMTASGSPSDLSKLGKAVLPLHSLRCSLRTPSEATQEETGPEMQGESPESSEAEEPRDSDNPRFPDLEWLDRFIQGMAYDMVKIEDYARHILVHWAKRQKRRENAGSWARNIRVFRGC